MTTTRIIKDAVCYNQGELAQYSYLASLFHKNLKEQYKEDPSNKERLLFLINNLTEYLNRNFIRISKKNFEFLQLYFDCRSDVGPRICLKGEYKGNIVEIFRECNVNYTSEYKADGNTGFKYVRDNGKYFLCNDIPSKAKKREYINPRLDPAKVTQYSTKPYLSQLFSKGRYSPDDEWIKCWVKPQNNIPAESSCYKSTLIIPMTLWNNKNLSDEFKNIFHVPDIERSIFGFLCFDHKETNYFSEEQDVNIGYIFADLLSLYLINRLNYTNISKTFNSVKDIVPEVQDSSVIIVE